MVEYLRSEKNNYLTFPWDNGTTAEEMAEYYDNMGLRRLDSPRSAKHP